MTNKTYFKFVENNEWEGEKWNFYIPLSEKEHNHLVELLDQLDTFFNEGNPYSLKGAVKESKVDEKVANSSGGYMAKHNKISSFKKDILLITLDDFKEDDPFYKGSNWIK